MMEDELRALREEIAALRRDMEDDRRRAARAMRYSIAAGLGVSPVAEFTANKSDPAT
jgi:hypothetical protein